MDLHHKPTLLKSWLATLHGPELRVRPVEGPLPGWGPLVRTAVGWHIAYVLFSYAAALVLARSNADNAMVALMHHGTVALVVGTVAFWWSSIALSTAVWWVGVRRARS